MEKRTFLSLIVLACVAVCRAADTAAPVLTKWEVKNATNNVVCILAQFNLNLTVQYNATNSQSKGETFLHNVTISLPQNAQVDQQRSSCDLSARSDKRQQIVLYFSAGKRHNFTIEFNQNADGSVDVASVIFEYDLADAAVFPNATINGETIQTAESESKFLTVPKDDYYTCRSASGLLLNNKKENKTTTLVFTDFQIQAFRNSTTDDFAGKQTVCPADAGSTTPSPVVTTTGTPIVGASYVLYNKATGFVCFYATFDTSVSLKYKKLDGNWATATIASVNNGTVDQTRSSCTNETALLIVGQHWIPGWEFGLNFSRNGNKYSLNRVLVNFDLQNSTAITNASDTAPHTIWTDVNLWSGTIGRSYRCKDSGFGNLNTTLEKDFVSDFQLIFKDLQVQPFLDQSANVTKPVFGQADECAADYTSDVVPIAVGCALAALVVIVLIAYVIGRRRNRARGYESM